MEPKEAKGMEFVTIIEN